MRTHIFLALVVLCGSVVVIGGVVGASSADTAPRYGSVTASSIAVGAEEEQQYLATMQELVEQFNVEPRDNAFVLTNGDKHWLVFTDKEPKTGKATVEGTIAVEATSNQRGAIFAESVSFNQDGGRADLADVRDNPEQYNGELVEVSANYRQLAYIVDGSEAVTKLKIGGRIGGDAGSLLEQPGASGRWAVRNLSATDQRWQAANRRAGSSEGTVLTVGNRPPRWWIDAKTTVDAVVLNVQGNAVLFVAKTDVESTKLDSVSEIAVRGHELEGEVVTVESQTVGSRISSQELLLSVAKCAPESVPFPATGCMPIPVDATVHSGVLFEGAPESFSDVVVYAGVSNHHQQKVSTSERGTYRVTGRVVSTEKIDPDLPDGYALVVYDMERMGGLQAGQQAREQADSYRSEVATEMRQQINGSTSSTTETQTGSGSAGGNGSSTAADDTSGTDSTSGAAEMEIVSVELTADKIEPGQSTAAAVQVRNSGSQQGELNLVLRVDGEVIKNTSVSLAPGESDRVLLGFSPSSKGEYKVAVSGGSAGTLRVGANTQQQQLLSEGVKELGGGLSALFGAVLFVSSFVIEFLRGIKEWRHGEVETSSRPAHYLLGGGGGAFVVGGLGLSGSEGGLVLFVGVAILLLLGIGISLEAIYESL